MDEIVAQHELRGGILALAVSLAERLSSGPDGAMPVDSRLLDSFMFRLPTSRGANFPPSGVTRLMRVHLPRQNRKQQARR